MRLIPYIFTIILLASCGTTDNSKWELTADTQVETTLPISKTDTSKSNLNISLDSLTSNLNSKTDWAFDKVQESKLLFKGGQTLETNLFELEYIGQITTDNKAPYLIFSGRHCDECDANVSIYIHSPTDGKLVTGHGKNRYQYPGTEKDYETDSVLYISRAFYGQVLEKIKGVIWYENRLLENGKMERSVFLSSIDNGILKDTIYEDNGKLAETISLLNKGKCSEIAGRKYKSEP